MMQENGVGPNGTESLDGENEWIKGKHSITLQKSTKESRCLEDWTIWSNEMQEEHSVHERKSPSWSTQEQRRT